MNRLHYFLSAVTGLRQFVRRYAPHFRYMLASRWISEHPLARQLITLLTMLAASLAVVLTGNHGAARTDPSEMTCGES
jgi:hypothetical protein